MKTKEPFYYITKKWYTGTAPAFYDNSEFPLTRLLEENAETIIQEVSSFYLTKPEQLTTNFVPYNVDVKGWDTMVLYSSGILNKKFLAFLPKTWDLIKDYPGLSLAMVSVLKPGVRLKAHFGDTDAMIRNHLGIIIPEPYPKVGMRIKAEERAWEVGKVLSFCVVNRHYAWNYSDKPRIILMVDFIKPEFLNRKKEIEGKILAAEGMKLFATKFPITKKIPTFLTMLLLNVLGVVANWYVKLFK